MLREYIDKYYLEDNYNCSESLLRAANEYYDLNLEEKEMKLVSGFGAGMQTGYTCGALLSSISVLSMKYVEKYAHESVDIKPVSDMLVKEFLKEFESLNCSDIKEKRFAEKVRCKATVVLTADILEKVLNEYRKEN